MKIVIEADGGSRGNPGVAGSGTVLYRDEQVIQELAYVVGNATNNVAEYHGLLNGLKAAYELGAHEVVVRMDSKLVVEQMSGRWKIKHPDMRELAMQCQQIVRNFDSISYNWIPRKNNARADELANKAMDALEKGHAIGFVSLSAPAIKKTELLASDAETTEKTPSNCPTSWNGATVAPTRFILLRHGQTPMSAQRQYSGRSNPALSEIGEQQAQRAAQAIACRGGIDAIVASPLQRCQQTAQYAATALGMDVRTIDDLIELDFGTWDGLTFSQAHEADPELHKKWLGNPQVATPGGESLQQVHRRVKKTLTALCAEYTGKTVLVVSHVTPIKSILRIALDAPAGMFHRVHLDLASISIAEFYTDGPTCVRLVNDTSHL
ncbi:2,3-bisphosphoglycerate-dependent phosphoglycerate mutase [Corynebacterium kutscheri]|uniref:2,3-bisphosphoglycerate-dependent phosphoglycerate mutase n=1 Tax=Corynebacterium kutscheri TaxID=35755 RepID=A0A0F6TDK1_9CORY|nr:bifunctional RNase H/acid phosphatase [Corynebacterium kutscheri]AKE40974.1 fructose-2,6-bisphosphatase [Corynebacterium kutscheri]VEH06835.1 2,3-bisphosphoglycerate-dependent phosphoglycerate mutase [Corynebacterium kutscheri]VEH09273.1 2,3-bisphosphoglycerate-dependent phosphoglycerate mutase [Corynebacterium kutscheri]VEH79361.1 2,3-bisphosphoglycerate-dependent phosphoglycerate mutase [Corynebacterium kutscheri]